MKACTLGKHHKWTHVRNKVFQTGNGQWVSVSLRGVYRCECGAVKKGEYVPDCPK